MPANSNDNASRIDHNSIQRRVAELGEWFHNLDLHGVKTAPNHFLGDYPNFKWRHLENALPADLRGMTVLDIGCNGGFFSIEMKKRGADRVVGMDHDAGYLAQARYAAEISGLDIEFVELSVYDVHQLREQFDIVLFMGVLYHLRYPLLALDLLAQHVVKDWLVFQSMLRGSPETIEIDEDYPFSEEAIFDDPRYPITHFVEKSYAHDPTNWWIPNRACAEAMLRSAGFNPTSRPDLDVFICRKDKGVIPGDGRLDGPALNRMASTHD
jgi:tRNA (mo5U34)-methyltransferase